MCGWMGVWVGEWGGGMGEGDLRTPSPVICILSGVHD